MKLATLCLFLAVLLTNAQAQLAIPRHVFSVEDLDEAANEANRKGHGLTFVYTSDYST